MKAKGFALLLSFFMVGSVIAQGPPSRLIDLLKRADDLPEQIDEGISGDAPTLSDLLARLDELEARITQLEQRPAQEDRQDYVTYSDGWKWAKENTAILIVHITKPNCRYCVQTDANFRELFGKNQLRHTAVAKVQHTSEIGEYLRGKNKGYPQVVFFHFDGDKWWKLYHHEGLIDTKTILKWANYEGIYTVPQRPRQSTDPEDNGRLKSDPGGQR